MTTVDPPNAGILHTVGSLGVNPTVDCGFDILDEDGTVTAYAAIQPLSWAARRSFDGHALVVLQSRRS